MGRATGGQATTGRGDAARRQIDRGTAKLGRAPSERRRSCRVLVDGQATMWRRTELRGYYRLHDLSIGGCQLIGGPARPIGEEVDVLLHLPHREALLMHGHVARAANGHVGLCFDAPSPRAEDYIQELVFDALVHQRAPQDDVILVVQPHTKLRSSIVQSLRELGMRSIGVSTALDAVQLLVEQGAHVRAAFIDAHDSAIPTQEIV